MKVKDGIRVFLLLSLVLLCVVFSAKADTTDVFTVSGAGIFACLTPDGVPISGCTPSPVTIPAGGVMTVDVTAGIVTDLEIPGWIESTPPPAETHPVIFNNGCAPTPDGCSLTAFAQDNVLTIDFTTPTPGSLVGFSGGTIENGFFGPPLFPGFAPIVTNITGNITPTPEPGTLALLLLGVGLVFVMRKRIGQRLPQAS